MPCWSLCRRKMWSVAEAGGSRGLYNFVPRLNCHNMALSRPGVKDSRVVLIVECFFFRKQCIMVCLRVRLI